MILAPFKWIVALFFNWSQVLFNDPGWAVVGMSVLLSLLLTPLYVWIERRKNSDKAKSAPMQAEIDKIEAVYRGRERYYYTREIQRRYRYSPWTAMIPTLGLLVQIPFLLAAYHYLSELPLFNGVSFGYIKDLSKPDTIAVVAGLPINLLAILMTVINLVSGWRYAESGKPKERIQYMSVAAIFLFLLYNCAASVVLYWTLSNALSFVRSEIFFRKKKAVACTSSANDDFLPVLLMTGVRFLLLVGVLTVLFVICGYDVRDVSSFLQARVLCRTVIGCFIMAGVCELCLNLRMGVGLTKVSGSLLAVIVFFLTIKCLAEFAGLPIIQTPVLDYLCRMWAPFTALIFVLFVVADAYARRRLCAARNIPADFPASCEKSLLVLAMACIGAQTMLCGPVVAYASFPAGATDVPTGTLVGYAFCGCVLLPALTWLLACAIPTTIRVVVWRVVLVAFVAMFAYGNLISFDYGVLFEGHYSKPENLVPSVGVVALEAVALSVLIMISGWLQRFCGQHIGGVRGVMLLIFVSYVLRAGYAVFSIPEADKHVAHDEVQSTDRQLFRFSAKGTNTLYVILDSVVGLRVGQLLEGDPELRAAFDGFTWYPVTISSGTCTFPNMPAMWGGLEYFPHEIGKKMKLETVFSDAWNKYKEAILSQGYGFSCTKRYARYYGISMEGVEHTWDETTYDRDSDCGDAGLSQNWLSLRGNSLLRVVPSVFRPLIYDKGHWHAETSSQVKTLESRNFDFMEDLPVLSYVDESDRKSYIHIHSESTHYPYLTRVDDTEKDCGIDSSFMCSLRSISCWIKWMKANGVYDNTRIVLCSDHGVTRSERRLMDMRYVKHIDRMSQIGHFSNLYFALLMVKDIGDSGPLKTDTQVKSISHGAFFALGDHRFLQPIKDICPSEVKNPPAVNWRSHMGFDVIRSFRISGDASDGDNWGELE